MSHAPTAVQELDAIARVLEIYIDGARSGKSADLASAFHEDATIFGYVGPDLFAGPIQEFYAWHDDNGPASTVQARTSQIDLAHTIATVRMEIDDWTGHRFTDMFTLLKVDGTWKIMNKVFHLHG
ncbi:MAG: nuclear transport factor 2 family protein [Phycisphaerales bacterium]|nr:nuclear transport factor 2 family protein [Phycisphaerales bacterium]